MAIDVELDQMNIKDFMPEFDRGSANISPYLLASVAATAYNESAVYQTGDYVTHGCMLYVCTADDTTGEWDDIKWQSTDIRQMIQDYSANADHVREIIDAYGGE